MAAATQASQLVYIVGGAPVFRVRFSAMTSDQIETLSYNFASLPAAQPIAVEFDLATAPTARCVFMMECDYTAASAVNKTVPARFYVEIGGDITGAIADVYVYFAPPGTAAQSSP